MMRILALVTVMMMPLAAQAQDPAASADAFAYCAAMAQASAAQHRDVVKDAQAAENMQTVANGYRLAAILTAARSMKDPEGYVNRTIEGQVPRYAAQLTQATDAAGEKFKTDAETCSRIEPQAYQLIQQYQASQAPQQ